MQIGDMEDEHIQNAIYLITENNWRRGYLSRLRLELEMRDMGIRPRVPRKGTC